MREDESSNHSLQRWQHALWLLIALVTPLFVNFWVEQQFEASKIWLLRTLVWLLAVLWLAARLTGVRSRALPGAMRTLLLLLLLVLALATLLSPHPTFALVGSLERAGGFLTQLSYLLLFLFVATQADGGQSRLLLQIILLTAAPICLLALAQAAGWQPLPVLTDARSLLTTTLGRANFTGAYLAMLVPLILTAALTARARAERIAYSTLALLTLMVIVLTVARAAWIAAVVGIAALGWLRAAPGWSRPARWLSAIGGGVVLTQTLLLLLQRGLADGGSIAARWTIWQASLRLLWPRLWLGYGADTLELHFPSVYPPQLVYYQGRGIAVDRAHNWLLDWSLSYGVVATLILVALLVLVFRLGWGRLTTAPPSAPGSSTEVRLDAPWVAACMAALCAQLVGNLLLFEVAATAALFWLLAALVVAASTRNEMVPSRPVSPAWLRAAVIVVAFVGVGGAIWQFNTRPLLADLYGWRGTRALSEGNLAVAMDDYGAAVAQQPGRAAYHVALGLTAARAGEFDLADALIQRAIRLRPIDPVMQTHLAAVYAQGAAERPERIALAYDAFERAILLAPTVALTHQQFADLALRQGDLETALVQAQRAVDLDATDAVSFAIAGWVWLQNGELQAAEQAFKEAVHWQPASADFHLGLATVYYQMGRNDAALAAVQQSLRLDPTSVPGLTLQLQLLEDLTPVNP